MSESAFILSAFKNQLTHHADKSRQIICGHYCNIAYTFFRIFSLDSGRPFRDIANPQITSENSKPVKQTLQAVLLVPFFCAEYRLCILIDYLLLCMCTALAHKGIDYEYRAVNLIKDGGEQVLLK